MNMRKLSVLLVAMGLCGTFWGCSDVSVSNGEEENGGNEGCSQESDVSTCENDVFKQCINNKWIMIQCESGCDSNGCKKHQSDEKCNNGNIRCGENGKIVEQCDENGDWLKLNECTYGCMDGKCIKACVSEDESRCSSNGKSIESCNVETGEWQPSGIECAHGCMNGECAKACTSKDGARCSFDGKSVETCNVETGEWVSSGTKCAHGCLGGECVNSCTEDDLRCSADGKYVEKCDEKGDWQNSEECKHGCFDKACVGGCTVNSLRCSENGKNVEICDEKGEWQNSEECKHGCYNNACVGVCTTNSQRCSENGKNTERCDGNGDWQIIDDCENGCIDGECIEIMNCGLSPDKKTFYVCVGVDLNDLRALFDTETIIENIVFRGTVNIADSLSDKNGFEWKSLKVPENVKTITGENSQSKIIYEVSNCTDNCNMKNPLFDELKGSTSNTITVSNLNLQLDLEGDEVHGMLANSAANMELRNIKYSGKIVNKSNAQSNIGGLIGTVSDIYVSDVETGKEGITIESPNCENVGGLFGNLTGSLDIVNDFDLQLKFDSIIGKSRIGGLLGNVEKGNVNINKESDKKITVSSGSISDGKGAAEHVSDYIGSLVGRSSDCALYINNIENNVDRIGGFRYIGGVIGGLHDNNNLNIVIVNVKNKVETIEGNRFLGGFVGLVDNGSGTVNMSENVNEIKQIITYSNGGYRGHFAGGFIGWLNGAFSINDITNKVEEIRAYRYPAGFISLITDSDWSSVDITNEKDYISLGKFNNVSSASRTSLISKVINRVTKITSLKSNAAGFVSGMNVNPNMNEVKMEKLVNVIKLISGREDDSKKHEASGGFLSTIIFNDDSSFKKNHLFENILSSVEIETNSFSKSDGKDFPDTAGFVYQIGDNWNYDSVDSLENGKISVKLRMNNIVVFNEINTKFAGCSHEYNNALYRINSVEQVCSPNSNKQNNAARSILSNIYMHTVKIDNVNHYCAGCQFNENNYYNFKMPLRNCWNSDFNLDDDKVFDYFYVEECDTYNEHSADSYCYNSSHGSDYYNIVLNGNCKANDTMSDVFYKLNWKDDCSHLGLSKDDLIENAKCPY